MSSGYVQIWVFNTYIHSVFLLAMFRFDSYWHGSTVYVWWPWPVLLDMDLRMLAFMLWVICILSMGMPTSVMIYYCTVFPCLLAGFRPTVPCSLHTLDKVFQLSLCSNFILCGALCYTLFSSSLWSLMMYTYVFPSEGSMAWVPEERREKNFSWEKKLHSPL